MISRIKLLCLALVIALVAPFAPADESIVLSSIGYGSCARQNRPQPVWEAVVEAGPDMFIFLGDNIYGDTEDMDVMREKYQMLADQPFFDKLRENSIIRAVWDDHDYGQNDAGKEYPMKRESQQVFLDFWGVPQDSPRRQQEGTYHAEVFGPPGQRVQIIYLDTRYFRDPLVVGKRDVEPGEGSAGRYLPNTDPNATILGATQWAWLREQLLVPAELRIVASSIQVASNEHGSEKWGNFPHERKRLFDLIRQTNANGVIFLSGDRHFSEISRIDAGEVAVSYPLYDVTASALNQSSGGKTKAGTRFSNEVNRHRVGRTYLDPNFGYMTIDWNEPDPVVRLQIRDEKGGVVIQQRVRLSELQPG